MDDYDALLYPKHANCRGILNKSTAAAHRCFFALQMLIFSPPELQIKENEGVSKKCTNFEKVYMLLYFRLIDILYLNKNRSTQSAIQAEVCRFAMHGHG